MREILFAPSLLGADPLNISGSIDSLGNNFDWLHLDIMDGHFVRNLSFGPAFSQALRKKYPDSFIDAHLMTNNLETVLPLFIESGASSITVHAETEPHLLHAVISTIRNAGIKAGIALCPPTSVRQIESILDIADLVLVMSVTPGFGGQKFIESSLEKVREVIKIAQEPVSLETPIGEEDDSHLGDFVKDERTISPEEYTVHELLKDEISDVLLTLTEREEQVLRLRFGLDDGSSKTLEEVGQMFGVTRERIRQIEAKALRKLRHPSRSRKLKDFLND